ncbi:MAG: hypothetical protein KIC37_06840 [Coriobacteriaceae bacterium]|nr:hypothetical protein [Coriobacteriaceae bacterium]
MTARDINGICKKLGIKRSVLMGAGRKLDNAASKHFDELPEWDPYEYAREILSNEEMRALALYYPRLQIAYPDVFGGFNS